MKATYWISLLVSSLSLVVAEPAGDGPRDGKFPKPRPGGEKGQRGPGGGSPGRGFAEFLKRADTDGDGKVSKDEFMALERLKKLSDQQKSQMFARLDKNGDGFVTADEMRVPNRPPRGPGGVPRIDEFDKNGDGVVSFEEFLESRFVQRLPEERRRALFDRLDTNGDGKLSPADRRRGDKGRGPGGRRPGVAPDEARGDLKERFGELDRNGDKALDFDEFREIPGIKERGEDFQEDRFEELDRNGDLKIQKDEFKAPMTGEGAPRRGPAGKGRPGPGERGPKDRPQDQ